MMKGKQYELIFLDIHMDKMNGIATAREIRKFDKSVLLIYVTSYENYAKEVFDVNPFRFIVKPVEDSILKKYLLEAYKEIIKGNYYFHYRFNKMTFYISVKDIMYFESDKRRIQIHLKDGIKLMYGKLNDIQKELSNGNVSFLRIHSSLLVSFLYIDGIGYDKIYLKDGMILPISREQRKMISRQYCDMD